MTEQPVEILLVEDNVQDAELTLYTLRRNHLANHVELVRDGEEALEFVFARGRYKNRSVENVPKVIMLDLKLPKVDGIDVLRAIKSDSRTRQVPVVVMTSSLEEQDMVESYELGVNSYIIKPVDFGQFTEAVRNAGLYWVLLNQLPNI